LDWSGTSGQQFLPHRGRWPQAGGGFSRGVGNRGVVNAEEEAPSVSFADSSP